MGCLYACTCSGKCWRCTNHKSEQYIGEAEDLLARQFGYDSYEDHMSSARREEDAPQNAVEAGEQQATEQNTQGEKKQIKCRKMKINVDFYKK
jgi:hypothetical protein